MNYAAGEVAANLVESVQKFRWAAGLARRCRRGIYLGLSELSEQGYEERGVLLRVIQSVLRQERSEE